MAWKPVVVAVLSSVLLAACSSSASSGSSSAVAPAAASATSTPSSGASDLSATEPTSLDDGALVIVPLPGVAPAVTRLQAARVLAGTFQGAGPRTPVVARVRVHVPRVSSAPPGSVTRLDLATAWVYTFPQPAGSVSCTAIVSGPLWPPTTTPAPVPATASSTYAVIVDGTTGRGYLYAGAGTGVCGGPLPAPALDAIQLEYSVAYQVHRATPRSARLTVTVPPCGRFESFTPSFVVTAGRRGMATVRVPAAPCAGRSTTLVQDIPGRFVESPHSAVGLMCGGAYDAELGRPRGCVTY